MSNSQNKLVWEQRWHPLREEWVLFSSHRGGRPWIGDTHSRNDQAYIHYDSTCALCPGTKRVTGENPQYSGVYWFTNDLPSFSEAAPSPENSDDFYRAKNFVESILIRCCASAIL